MSEPTDDDFVRENRSWVRGLAVKIRAQLELHCELDDLLGYAHRGLLEARARFDPERGVRFKTFAYYRVRGAIIDGVREMAYMPRRVHAARRAAEALDRAAEEEANRRGAEPARQTDASAALEAIDQILGRTSAAFVIAAMGQHDDASSDPEAEVASEQERARVRAALDVLDDRERALIEGHYFGDRTLEEIGAEMGISKSWASRLCTRALDRMRHALSD